MPYEENLSRQGANLTRNIHCTRTHTHWQNDRDMKKGLDEAVLLQGSPNSTMSVEMSTTSQTTCSYQEREEEDKSTALANRKHTSASPEIGKNHPIPRSTFENQISSNNNKKNNTVQAI